LAQGGTLLDAKSMLHERVQTRPGAVLEYRLASETGPDHDKRFCCEALIDGHVCGRGEGKSKREGEQEAAKAALAQME